MTPAGWEALASATRQSLENTVHLYTETREHIRTGLAAISGKCTADGEGMKRVIFYGAGDVAEIAYVSLLSTELLGQVRFDHVIVTSLRHADAIRTRLAYCGMASDRIFTLL